MDVSGILHCTALWREFRLFYSLLSFTRAHVYFCFSLAFISRGWSSQYWFSATSPGYPPLRQRLFTANTCRAPPAPTGPFLALGAAEPASGQAQHAGALIPLQLPSRNDGCELLGKCPAVSPPLWRGSRWGNSGLWGSNGLWEFPSRMEPWGPQI